MLYQLPIFLAPNCSREHHRVNMVGQCFIYILIYLEVDDASGIGSDMVFDRSVERFSQL